MRRRSLLFLVAVLVGCGGPSKDPVDQLLDGLSRAVEDRNVDGVGQRMAEDFQGASGMTRADALATVRRYLAAYEKVGVQVFDVQRTDDTRLTFRVDFSGKPKDLGGLAGMLPSAAVYEFEMELVGVGADLKIRRADWRPWQPPASP